MFKKLLSLAALLLCVGSMNAQVAGVVPEAGQTYYIYNVGAKMYMNHGSSWGTHVTVDGAGCAITIGGETDAYTIHHYGIDDSKYQTEDGWSDNTTPGTFTFESAGDNVYYIKCSNGSYYYWAGGVGQYGDEAVVSEANGETDAYKWIFVPEANRTALTAGNDVTYLLSNPDFTVRALGWNEQSNAYGWTGDLSKNNWASESQVAYYSGQFNEQWVAYPNALSDYTRSQTLTLPAGTYTFSVTANATIQSDPNVDATGAYVFAGDNQTELSMWATKSVDFTSDGFTPVELGVKTVNTTANWISIDKFRLVFKEAAYVPAVADGIYYLKTADGRYLSRGDNYNTCAIADNYGIAVKVQTDASNITKFTFVDNNLNLFDANNGTVYTDNTSYPNWEIVAVDGGYNIVNLNDLGTKGNALWIEANTSANYKYDRFVTKDGGTPTVFTFENLADHKAAMVAKKDAQAAAVAAAFGETSITTKAALDELVSTLPKSTMLKDMTGGKELYQNVQNVNMGLGQIPNGLYKVSATAFQRITFYSDELADYASPVTTLYANDEEVQISSPFDQKVTSATAWSDASPLDVEYNGLYYPNNMTSAKAAIAAGNYLNEVYVYVTNNELKLGIYKANKCGNGDWLYYEDFEVTYYGEYRATEEGKYGTICLPYAPEVNNATLYSASVNADKTAVVLTEVTEPVAGVPYIYQATSEDTQTFSYVGGSIVAAPVDAAPLTGVFEATEVPVGSYVLQTKDDAQKFYVVADGKQPTLSAYKAYLTAPEAAGAKVLGFDDPYVAPEQKVDENGVPLAISAIESLTSGDAKIYDVNGRQLKQLQKGINIVNGVKVLVK